MIGANNWADSTPDTIWWGLHEDMIRTVTPHKRSFNQKFIHNKSPTNYCQNKYYSYKTNKCRICTKEVETETSVHIIKYQGYDNRKTFMDKYTLELRVTFEKN
jgi:hypothetical protein